MSQANERAEAILLVLKRLALWALIGLVALVGIVFGYAYIADYFDQKERSRIQAQVDLVLIEGFPAGEACSKDHPYLVRITNNSSKTVELVSAEMQIKRPGFSKQINRLLFIESDRILAPGQDWSLCYMAFDASHPGKLLRESLVDIHFENKRVTFDGDD